MTWLRDLYRKFGSGAILGMLVLYTAHLLFEGIVVSFIAVQLGIL